MAKVCIKGYDNGFGNQDLVGRSGAVNVASHLAEPFADEIAESVGLREADDSNKPALIEFNGDAGTTRYYTGLGAHLKGTPVRSQDYSRLSAGGPLSRALFYASLTAYIKKAEGSTKPRTPLSIWSAMPLDTMRSGIADKTKADVRSWMTGQHNWIADGEEHRVKVDNVNLASQPMAALYDYVLDGNGNVRENKLPELQGEIGVISIGMNDLAFMVIDGMSISEGKTRSYTSGVSFMLDRATRGKSSDIERMDIRLRRNVNDPIFTAPKGAWRDEIQGKSREAWGQDGWRGFERILCIGGGVLVCKGDLIDYYGDLLHISRRSHHVCGMGHV